MKNHIEGMIIMNTENLGKPIDILLVEDNPGDARLALESLKDSKIRNTLHWVQDGLEAMKFLHRQGSYENAPRADLILLDLNMPKMDGRKVLAEIKSDDDLKRILPIIPSVSC
jgi:CheY-like chemotaxis protein